MFFFSGAIELAILSDFYGREIAAYDIQTKRCDVYGQVKRCIVIAIVLYTAYHSCPYFVSICGLFNFRSCNVLNCNLLMNYMKNVPWFECGSCDDQAKGYTERVMLIYDGLHYDALGVRYANSFP